MWKSYVVGALNSYFLLNFFSNFMHSQVVAIQKRAITTHLVKLSQSNIFR